LGKNIDKKNFLPLAYKQKTLKVNIQGLKLKRLILLKINGKKI